MTQVGILTLMLLCMVASRSSVSSFKIPAETYHDLNFPGTSLCNLPDFINGYETSDFLDDFLILQLPDICKIKDQVFAKFEFPKHTDKVITYLETSCKVANRRIRFKLEKMNKQIFARSVDSRDKGFLISDADYKGQKKDEISRRNPCKSSVPFNILGKNISQGTPKLTGKGGEKSIIDTFTSNVLRDYTKISKNVIDQAFLIMERNEVNILAVNANISLAMSDGEEYAKTLAYNIQSAIIAAQHNDASKVFFRLFSELCRIISLELDKLSQNYLSTYFLSKVDQKRWLSMSTNLTNTLHTISPSLPVTLRAIDSSNNRLFLSIVTPASLTSKIIGVWEPRVVINGTCFESSETVLLSFSITDNAIPHSVSMYHPNSCLTRETVICKSDEQLTTIPSLSPGNSCYSPCTLANRRKRDIEEFPLFPEESNVRSTRDFDMDPNLTLPINESSENSTVLENLNTGDNSSEVEDMPSSLLQLINSTENSTILNKKGEHPPETKRLSRNMLVFLYFFSPMLLFGLCMIWVFIMSLHGEVSLKISAKKTCCVVHSTKYNGWINI